MKKQIAFAAILSVFTISTLLSVDASAARYSQRTSSMSYEDDSYSRSEERPNALGIELLGRAGLWSVNYDRSVSESMSVGLGFSHNSVGVLDGEVKLTMVPLYANYYFLTESHRPLITGGLTIVHVSVKDFGTSRRNANPEDVDTAFGRTSRASATAPIPVIGTGYEFRGDGGFLFRAQIYGILANDVLPWAGLTFGAAF